MREIKFRAWEKVMPEDAEEHPYFHGKMISIGSPGAIESILGFCLKRPDEYDVMQSTGLHDKNGKEIFEGDVVKYCHWNDCDWNTERKWKTAQIIWDDKSFRFTITPQQPMNSLYESKMYEVIGNIYENPELLAPSP